MTTDTSFYIEFHAEELKEEDSLIINKSDAPCHLITP